MAFRYNTRGNAAPNGKTRVYLYCHPKDYALYFDDVSKELLDQVDCAVYSAENGKLDLEEMRFELQQMNLIVAAVSAAVLRDRKSTRLNSSWLPKTGSLCFRCCRRAAWSRFMPGCSAICSISIKIRSMKPPSPTKKSCISFSTPY